MFARFIEVFAYPAQTGTYPEKGRLRRIDQGKRGLAFKRRDEFAELGACKLDKRGRSGGAATKPLKNDKGGEYGGSCRRGGVEFDFDRDRIAGSGRGKIGRKQEAQHGVTRLRLVESMRTDALC